MRRTIITAAIIGTLIGLDRTAASAPATNATNAPGGIVVALGCRDADALLALHAGGKFTVQALDRDAGRVAALRQQIEAAGAYGQVSVRFLEGDRLPYADDLINTVVAEDMMGIGEKEILRVVAPLGTARIQAGGNWKTVTKPWPKDIDEWTHFLHDPSNNAVAKDARVGPPRRLQWFAGSLWGRSHEFNNSFPALVTTRGRLFYIFDKGITGMEDPRLPEKWTLIARDAFNGKLLWERPLPAWGSDRWKTRALRFFAGAVARRLVAVGDRLFCTVDYGGPVQVLDAATGQTVLAIPGTEGAEEILVDDGLLVCSTMPEGQGKGAAFQIIAHDVKANKPLWRVSEKRLTAQLLSVGPAEVVYHNGSKVVCLNRTDGAVRWEFVEPTRAKAKEGKGGGGRMLVLADDKVVLAVPGKVIAISVKDGGRLWEAPGASGDSMQSYDLFVAQGRVWISASGGKVRGYDLDTGKLSKEIDGKDVQSYGHHLRCYRAKATEGYLITQYRGVEFLSMGDAPNSQNDWLRGTCTYGVMPANGFLYSPPHSCFCFAAAMYTGLKALARDTGDTAGSPGPGPLEKGPAFAAAQNLKPETHSPSAWPSYRHDAQRTGATDSPVSASLKRQWKQSFGTRLSQPVAADGRLFVAAKERHQILALDAASGKTLWTFTGGARIDSPPSLRGGLVLFGCADGCLYCLRATDGQLAWRRRMAPADRWVASEGQLESVWRLHGSVLIEGDIAYTCAGRSSFLDGGLFLAAVKIPTGEIVHQARLDTRMDTREDRKQNEFVPAYHIEGANSDILVAEGGFIYLNQMKFTPDLKKQPPRYLSKEESTEIASINLDGKPYVNEDIFKVNWKGTTYDTYDKLADILVDEDETVGEIDLGRHLFTTSGFLDDTLFNRTYWMYSATWPGFNHAILAPKAGQLVVIGDTDTYAFKAYTTRYPLSPSYTPETKGYLLIADANDNDPTLDPRAWGKDKGMGFSRGAEPKWHRWIPIRALAMVKAGDKIVICGPPDELKQGDPLAAFEGRLGSRLWAISAHDGEVIAKQDLPEMPAFDGMIASDGRLYLSTQTGDIICLGDGS